MSPASLTGAASTFATTGTMGSPSRPLRAAWDGFCAGVINAERKGRTRAASARVWHPSAMREPRPFPQPALARDHQLDRRRCRWHLARAERCGVAQIASTSSCSRPIDRRHSRPGEGTAPAWHRRECAEDAPCRRGRRTAAQSAEYSPSDWPANEGNLALEIDALGLEHADERHGHRHQRRLRSPSASGCPQGPFHRCRKAFAERLVDLGEDGGSLRKASADPCPCRRPGCPDRGTWMRCSSKSAPSMGRGWSEQASNRDRFNARAGADEPPGPLAPPRISSPFTFLTASQARKPRSPLVTVFCP